MTDKLVILLAEAIDRRSFLRRAGATALGVVAALLGVPMVALAYYPYGCCNLCQPRSQSCSNCACTWCWTCIYGSHQMQCCECHRDPDYCGSGCSNVICSYVNVGSVAAAGAGS
jgi:hypothetical protein